MEAVGETKWDLVIDGTGLAESLLALSLSRSGRNILHVDRNPFYGGAQAALSLQDAEEWATQGTEGVSPFAHAEIVKSESSTDRLGFSRAYSLALAPQIIYTRSVLLPTLVSSKIYRQIDFLALGSWFVYEIADELDGPGRLVKIPAGREDVFADKSIGLKAKRLLIKFLRTVSDPDAQAQAVVDAGNASLATYLTEQYSLPEDLQAALAALTLSPVAANRTPASWALPRIGRHLASLGVFGPGFAAVVPKWGGLSEVAQHSCRALAVGGGTYMLGHGIEHVETAGDAEERTNVKLRNGDTVSTQWLADVVPPPTSGRMARSVNVVASTLAHCFPLLGDGAPPPAAAVVALPPATVDPDSPIYLIVHSSATGECPEGQCVVYGSTVSTASAFDHLRTAVVALLRSAGDPESCILWTMQYTQDGPSALDQLGPSAADRHHVRLQPLSMDLAFDDAILRDVRSAWQTISGEEEGFMDFEDREIGAYDDDDAN